ncbi:MAG: hypothetical protein JO002_03105 [Burkholderiaceae bacterium]|nr:hypothetical protein [Burkholderiaceae bacterium]
MLTVLLAGCTNLSACRDGYEQGWRAGEVQATEAVTAIYPVAGIDCRSSLQLTGAQRIAYIQFVFDPIAGKYFYGGPKHRHAIVPIPEGVDLQAGERVYVNILDCRLPLRHEAIARVAKADVPGRQ